MVARRSELKREDTWDLSLIYPSMEKWNEDFFKFYNDKGWDALSIYRQKLSDSKTLKEVLDKYFSLSRHVEKIYTYAHLYLDQDLTDDSGKQAFGKANAMMFEFQAKTSWIEPEILQLPTEIVDKILQETTLKEYHFYLRSLLHNKEHILSAEQEEILAEMGKTFSAFYKTFSSLNNADLHFSAVTDAKGSLLELTHGTYGIYQRSHDRELRKNAFYVLHNRYKEFENTCADLIDAEVGTHCSLANVRKYQSALEAALYPKNIDLDVYHNLIKTVRKKIGALHHYLDLKKRCLQLPSLHFYDIYAPFTKQENFSFSLQEAKEAVVASVAVLGQEYQSILQKGIFENRWCDFYENVGKRSGAYSSGCYDTLPYILMNYHGTLNDVFTLAHEAGHSMHSYFSRENQPYHYASYPIFVAEVASTFSEQLLFRYLLDNTKDTNRKIQILTHKLEMIQATLFRQTLFADFEFQIHEKVAAKEPLTPSFLNTLYQKLYREYYGKALSLDEPLFSEWARIPHFYYNFYVYQYATGVSSALYLSQNIDSEKYMAFIASGGNGYPIDLLKIAGVDIKNPEVIEAAIDDFAHQIGFLESLL
ncbi:MAG: oligoendopeptidase F [Parachlamydiales bacterium]|nr:oligoendopeptidase F [Parachlamydiales bacterium]